MRDPSFPFEDLINDFSGEGKANQRDLLMRAGGRNQFKKQIRTLPDDSTVMLHTRGMSAPEVTKTKKRPKEPEDYLFYGVPVSLAAPFGMKDDFTPMTEPAYWGQPAAGEVEKGSAVLRMKKDVCSVKRNKAWVTKLASGGDQAHPGNAWWEDSRTASPRKRKRLSWWAPLGLKWIPGTSTPASSLYAGLGSAAQEYLYDGENNVFMTSYLGAPLLQGRVFIDGVKEVDLGRQVVAAAIYVDNSNKKFIRFLSPDTTHPYNPYDGRFNALQLCSYSYETDTVTAVPAYVADAYCLCTHRQFFPRFNSSGTKFMYLDTSLHWCEVDFSNPTESGITYESTLFPFISESGAAALLAEAIGNGHAHNVSKFQYGLVPNVTQSEVVSYESTVDQYGAFAWYSGDSPHVLWVPSAVVVDRLMESNNEFDIRSTDQIVSTNVEALAVDNALVTRPVARLNFQRTGPYDNEESWVLPAWAQVSADYGSFGHFPVLAADGLNLIGNFGYFGPSWELVEYSGSIAGSAPLPSKKMALITLRPRPLGVGQTEADRAYDFKLDKNLNLGDSDAIPVSSIASSRNGEVVVLSGGLDAYNASAHTTEKSYFKIKGKDGIWRSIKNRISSGNAANDRMLRVDALICVDKEIGYYDDDGFFDMP